MERHRVSKSLKRLWDRWLVLRLDLPKRYSKTSVHAPRTVWHTSKPVVVALV